MCLVYMASSHLRNFPSSDDVIIPWNTRYPFPTIANKAEKVTSNIPSTVSGPFTPKQTIRLEFPAQGYINFANSFINFDVEITGTPGIDDEIHFQNDIQSTFSRMVIKYGATVLEDISDYGKLARAITEWTATAGQTFDQTSIALGIGNAVVDTTFQAYTPAVLEPPADAFITTAMKPLNIRQTYIQSVSTGSVLHAVKSYSIQPLLGLWQQKRLIPAKYMANQLAIEITLNTPQACMVTSKTSLGSSNMSYKLSNVHLSLETLEYDSSFDEMFLKGLQTGGIPIKFSTWRQYTENITGSTVSYRIPENAKSVKSIYAMLDRSQKTFESDSGAAPFFPGKENTLQEYQYQVGTKMYPSSPVVCGTANVPNGAPEAYHELTKAIYTVGNYQLSSAVNIVRWGYPLCESVDATGALSTYTRAAEADFAVALRGFSGDTFTTMNHPSVTGSQCFAMAISLETATSADYSGLNAEEASSINFKAMYSAKPGSTSAGCTEDIPLQMLFYTYIDKLMVLNEYNSITIIE